MSIPVIAPLLRPALRAACTIFPVHLPRARSTFQSISAHRWMNVTHLRGLSTEAPAEKAPAPPSPPAAGAPAPPAATASVPFVGAPAGNFPKVKPLKKPDLEHLKKNRPSTHFYELSNEELLLYVANDNFEACRERLIREIMAVNNKSWDEAQPILKEIEVANKTFCTGLPVGYLARAPYFLGASSMVVAAFASTLLVFHRATAERFNELYVTADLAEEKDLETWLEVGSWTWSWMEPVLGQVSFFILCFAFARNQMINLNWKPYTSAIKNLRARRLQERYPQMNGMILYQYSVNADWN